MQNTLSTVRDAGRYDTDKSRLYLENYEEYFKDIKDREIKLFELGVRKGGSLLLWRDYFSNGTIVGLDIKPCSIDDPTGRIHVYQGFQEDVALLDRIGKEVAPDGYDIIIDDASHLGELTRFSFWHLFDNHLKPGGVYVIEDWRTGYWDHWADGHQYKSNQNGVDFRERIMRKPLNGMQRSLMRRIFDKLTRRKRFPSHCWGMVGVIKELIDELGMDAITNPRRNSVDPQRYPKFRKMQITPGQVFILKATEKDHELIAEQLIGPD